MSKTIFIIAISFALLIGAGYFVINSNPALKAKAIEFGVIDAPEPAPKPVSYNAVFCIFDPSGSGRTTYSVPYVTVEFFQQLIDLISGRGSGELWVTFIDRNASNNKVIYLKILSKSEALVPPTRYSGELKGEFDRRLLAFKSDSLKFAVQNDQLAKQYSKERIRFLAECREMIKTSYAPKSITEDYSDVIGSLNAACRTFTTIEHDSLHFRSILLISDGVQDIPKGDRPKTLTNIPQDILLVTVNNSGSQNSVVSGRSLEVDNLDRGMDKVVRMYNPLNH